MKRNFYAITALLLFLPELLQAEGKLVPLKDSKIKDTEYSAVLCFRLTGTDKRSVHTKNLGKGKTDYSNLLELRYFDGAKLEGVTIKYHSHWNWEEQIRYDSGMIYLAAKPGKYDLFGLFDTQLQVHYPINLVIEIEAGKAYYAGEINIIWEENQKYNLTLFKDNKINDRFLSDFQSNYPNSCSIYKSDLAQAVFSLPSPVQPTKVIFSSHFVKSEGIWHESDDSLHISSYENGHYFIEGKSGNNLGSEVIELPEKLGNTFDIELRCARETGVSNYAYGLVIPGHDFSRSDHFGNVLKPCDYIFGISASGFACIWYEGYYTREDIKKSKLTRIGLTDWKSIPNIKTNFGGQNIIRVQVIDKIITYYINDVFVSRAPHNGFPGIYNYMEFLNTGDNLLGIFSYNRQKIEFDEIKVSKF
jgi:hypothetical protein